ncbi:MAG: CPBP family intramembrane metalloprotease, partial [Candidatus Heimdallarchaeota archaeon]
MVKSEILKENTSRDRLQLDFKRTVLALTIITSATLLYTMSRFDATTIVSSLLGSSASSVLQIALSLVLVLLFIIGMIFIIGLIIGESLISPPLFTPIDAIREFSTIKISIVFFLFTFACPILITSVLTLFSFYSFVQTQKVILADLIDPIDPLLTLVSLILIVTLLGPLQEELIFRVFNGFWLEQTELRFTVKISIISGLFWMMHFMYPDDVRFVVPWMIEVLFGAYLFYFLYRAQGQTNPTYIILLPLIAHVLVNGLDVVLVLLELYFLDPLLVEIFAVILALCFLISSGILYHHWHMQGIFPSLSLTQALRQIGRSMVVFFVTILGFFAGVILIQEIFLIGLSMLLYLVFIVVLVTSVLLFRDKISFGRNM